MDLNALKDHVDSRLDRIETKLDATLQEQATQKTSIEHLQGFAKLAISIFIAGAGFFALAFFTNKVP